MSSPAREPAAGESGYCGGTRPFAIRKEVHFGDRVLNCFADRPSNIQELFAATVARSPDAIAVQDGDLRMTYRELDRMAAQLAGGFGRLGVGKGDRVALILDNRPEFVAILLACIRIGAIAVPLGTRLRKPEITYIMQNSGARVIVHEDALTPEIPSADEAPGLDHRVPLARLAAVIEKAGAADPVAIAEEDIFCIMYTSGTTGRPKGAIITHLGIVHSCLHWVERLGLAQGISSALVVPASHISGLGGVVMPLLHLGGRLLLIRGFKAHALLETLASERIEHALLVPAMYNLCLLDPEFARLDLSAWKWAVYGGASMPEPTIRRFAELLPDLLMLNAYGATETTSPATIMLPGKGLEHSDSIGHVVACGDMRVLDDAGREVEPGESGELYIAGPMVVPGYWENPEATAASFVGGYWKSGDIGSIDRDGYVRIFDRKKDMVNRGGYKIYPAEVESVLADHPAVIESAIVGKPDDILGERVVAFVQARDAGVSQSDLQEFCRQRLADYKVPDIVNFLDGPLPRNANGKIQKNDLRALLAD